MITSIQFRSQQVGDKIYDAIVMHVGGLRFTSDVNHGHQGDLALRKARRIADESGISLDCFESRLLDRLSTQAP